MTLQELYDKIGGNYATAIERFSAEEVIEMLLPKFAEDPSFGNLKNAIDAGDIEASFQAAHTLKGVTGNFSFDKLYKVTCDLVEQLRPRSEPADMELYNKVADVYNETVSELNSYLN